MKKLLVIPAVIGLLAVPSIALARHGADDNQPNNIRREDRRQDSITTPSTQVSENTEDDSNSSNDDDHAPVVVPEGSITVDQAITIAMGVFPDKAIKEVETETEHGVIVFSVRFTDSSRVDVSANDGSILRTESEHDDNDSDSNSDDSSDHDSNED